MRPQRAGLVRYIFIAALTTLCFGSASFAQTSSPYSEKFEINAPSATTWSSDNANILQLTGGVTISLDQLQCSADNAVIWITPAPGGLLQEQQADIVLLGNAKLSTPQNHLTRTAPTLLVTTIIRGSIQLNTQTKLSQDLSQSLLYLQAKSARDSGNAPAGAPSQPVANIPLSTEVPPPPPPTPGSNVSGVIQPAPTKAGFVTAAAKVVEEIHTPDGSKAFQLSGGVQITQTSPNGDFLELYADNAILFTSDKAGQPLASVSGNMTGNARATGGYLEGDVRVVFTPVTAKHSEQRMTADRVYYDFQTQQAVLTDVIFHSIDPTSQIPFTVRAQSMKQIAHNEFSAQHVEFTTSRFAVPTFDVRASYAYIHQEPDLTDYDIVTRDDVPHLYGVPVFFWPALSGTLSTQPFPLETFSGGNSSRYGFTLDTEWNLFQTFGQTPPKDLSLNYQLGYWSDRGVGGGLDGTYKGGFITDADQPSDFDGDFKAFIMSDKGIDQLGGLRTNVDPPTELRGRVLWEHEQFLPDNWQVQVRAGYLSDPTFLEEWYQSEFDNTLPYDAEFYVKHQQDTEVLSFLATTDTTRFITNADRQQEQFDVARLPEITYQRIGDSAIDDTTTYFGNTSGSVLKMDVSDYSLQQQGFYPGLSPGTPSDGYTGVTGNYIYRGDTRHELDYPISIGQLKIVPYVMGEATAYSDSPGGDEQTRLYGGTGLRATTTFWRVDDSVESDLLDLHRIRHVIQPEVNIFTSASSLDASKVYIFDPNIDAVSDITAMQVALHQHWETMRGGPGRWQSVDLLDVNVEGDFYPHQPPPNILAAQPFRGLFFPSEVQTSVPRQSIYADATWHIADDTAVIGDYQWDIDKRETAIAECGLAVNRGSRLSYYVGDAYIQALESQVVSFNATYNLTTKYSLAINQALDFGASRAAVTSFTVTRRFDVVALSVSVYHDGINNISGFSVNLFPSGQPGYSRPFGSND